MVAVRLFAHASRATSRNALYFRSCTLVSNFRMGTSPRGKVPQVLFYSYSTTLAHEVRNACSSGLRFTSWDAATMGIHFCTY